MMSKKLIGSFMLFGPFLAIATIFIEPGGTSEASFAETVQTMADNYLLSSISLKGWAAAVLAIFIGIHFLARSMQGEDKPGSDLAGLASIFALLVAGVAMVSLGIELTIGEKESSWIEQGGDVVNATALSSAISRSIFFFNGLVILFLGLAIVKQKNLNQIVGGLFAFFGACILIGGMFSAGDNLGGMIWFIGFLGFPFTTAATGFLILRSARKESA